MLSPEADVRYQKMVTELQAQKAAGTQKVFTTVDDFMKDLKA